MKRESIPLEIARELRLRRDNEGFYIVRDGVEYSIDALGASNLVQHNVSIICGQEVKDMMK